MKEKFYICERCGNLIGVIHNSGVPMVCCGQKMTPLVPNTVDASGEKHTPVISVKEKGITVRVGSVDHPMTPEHLIQWIYVETEHGGMRKVLTSQDSPCAEFCLGEDKPVAVYAYCNLHGLWMTQV